MRYDPVSLGAAPLVASALGRSINVKVEVNPSASTAYVHIDPKTGRRIIVLPLLPVDLDDSLARILWGFIHHEAGHCRHSDFDVLSEPELRSDLLLNGLFRALEDIRMERAHIKLYPGASRVLSDLVRELVETDFFTPLDDDCDLSTAFHAFVLKHLRASVLGQHALAEQASDARKVLSDQLGQGFATRLVAELQSILSADSTVDALNVAYRIREFLKEELEQQQQPPSSPPSRGDPEETPSDSSSASADSSDGDDGDSDGPAASAAPDSDDPPPPSSEGDDSDDSADPGGLSAVSPQEEGDSTESGDDQSDAIDALQQILGGSDLDSSLGDLGEALSDVVSDGIKDQVSRPLSLPGDDCRSIGRRDADSVREARAVSARLAVQLKRQLESYNDVLSDPSTRGKRISRRHLSRVAFKDYRVFAHREYLPSVNTAVVSLIDVSGSMANGRIEKARQSILATSLALETIPSLAHAVGAFPSMEGSSRVELVQDFHEQPDAISSRFALHARGTTPMAEALLWAADRLLQRSEERRIVFVATDGSPDDVDSTKRILAHLRRLGIEVHGLGIDTDDDYDLFDSFAEVTGLSTLPSSFLKLFQRVLRRSA